MNGKSPAELLDPRSEESVVNPASPNFLTVEVGGVRLSPFASALPVARVLLKPPADATGEAAQAQKGFLGAVGVFLDAYAKSEAEELRRAMVAELVEAVRIRAHILAQSDKLPQAIEELEKASAKFPNDVELAAELADAQDTNRKRHFVLLSCIAWD